MWTDEQVWERDWWGNCVNTLHEEWKQLAYFKRLGLQETKNAKYKYVFDMQGKSVLDIGGGPCSFLLKCVNLQDAAVIDPCGYPKWVRERYKEAGISFLDMKAESIEPTEWEPFDEVWIYNVLQHVEDPEKIIQNARRIGKLIRFFDWLDTRAAPGHPHTLTEEKLNSWLGGKGTVEDMNENDAFGKAYYGIFPQRS